MFSMNNLPPQDIQHLKNVIAPQPSPTSQTDQAFHQMQAPFTLQFYTYHPDNEKERMIFAFLSPDQILYSSSSAAEVEPFLSGGLHQHDFYELLFVVEGSLYQNIENKRHLYIPGSCCLLNKNVRHKEEYSSDFRIIFFQFSEHFIREVFSALSMNYFQIERDHVQTQMEQFLQQNIAQTGSLEKNYIDFIPNQNASWMIQNVHSIFEQITMELLSPQFGSSAFITALVFKLFHLLDQPRYYRTTPVKIGTDTESGLFQQITRLMDAAGGNVSRKILGEKLHYSGDYLNKIVKKYTGLTIYEYALTFRMKKAASLLLHSDSTVAEIALELGFSNRTHFYKLFENHFHMTPSAYRKNHPAKEDLSL